MTAPYYVYRLFDGDKTLYIGKGSGPRLAVQINNFGCQGEILEQFSSESDAYAAEVRLIEQHSPPHNKNPGGGGNAQLPPEMDYDRILSVVAWYITTISDYPPQTRENLRRVHNCVSDAELTAKLIADCLTGRLGG